MYREIDSSSCIKHFHVIILAHKHHDEEEDKRKQCLTKAIGIHASNPTPNPQPPTQPQHCSTVGMQDLPTTMKKQAYNKCRLVVHFYQLRVSALVVYLDQFVAAATASSSSCFIIISYYWIEIVVYTNWLVPRLDRKSSSNILH